MQGGNMGDQREENESRLYSNILYACMKFSKQEKDNLKREKFEKMLIEFSSSHLMLKNKCEQQPQII